MGIYNIHFGKAMSLFEAMYGEFQCCDSDVTKLPAEVCSIIYHSIRDNDSAKFDGFNKTVTEHIAGAVSYSAAEYRDTIFNYLIERNKNAIIAMPFIFHKPEDEPDTFEQLFDELVTRACGINNLYFVVNLKDENISMHNLTATLVYLGTKGFVAVRSADSEVLVCHKESWEDHINENIQSESEE